MDYEELREAARASLPPMSWEYFAAVAGGGPEADHAAWGRIDIVPRMFRGLSSVDATTVLDPAAHRGGAQLPSPFFVAPMAAHRLAHADAELATAAGASAEGALIIYSSSATVEVGEFGRATTAPWWAQVYLMKDRGLSRDYVARAVEGGAGALVLTLDYPGIIASPSFRTATRSRMGVRPANYPGLDWTEAAAAMDPAVTTEHIALLADWSGLPVHVKGILRESDAELAVREGASGVIVSNHGRRQVPGVVPTATVLAGIVDAVGGGVPVMVDGGVRSAADALRALALGASLVGVGRPALWALATEGAPGVARVLGELTEELRNLMASCGAATISELDRGFVRDVP